jgi:phage pi2 protein 07
LHDALAAGFLSVEADVFLVENRLLVAHERRTLKPERTLENLYLAPLAKRLRENGGWVYPGEQKSLWVLIDIKAEGAAAYRQFKKELTAFPELAWNPAKPAIRFVISGDRPIDSLVSDEGRFAGLDGRWGDWEKGYSKEFMPWISESWRTHFLWFGRGDFTEGQKLEEMVKLVQSQGRKIRFWGSPDTQASWRIQWLAGVDWVNTDQPDAFRRFASGQAEDTTGG